MSDADDTIRPGKRRAVVSDDRAFPDMPPEGTSQILMLRAVLQAQHALGDSVGGLRGEVQSVAKDFAAHIQICELRHLAHEKKDGAIDSDIRGLKKHIGLVEATSGQTALTVAGATAALGAQEKSWGFLRSIALAVVAALAGAIVAGLL